ncbi:MAG: hypothetical protein IPO53_10410 [Chitinophagaceae bacterium]|nr:hypothetical protein [Chitinophagaceae bacterium]
MNFSKFTSNSFRTLTARRFLKKLFKVTGITLGIVMVLLTGFHFWFKAHARQFIETLVESKSNGKIKLNVEKIHFNYFSRNIELDNAEFYNTDTITGTTAYHFKVDKMQLRVKALLPIILKNQILIDSLTLQNPQVEVYRLRVAAIPGKKVRKDVSIPEEMGKVYASIQDALKILKIQRFQIDNGTFLLVNKIDPAQLPLTVSNIHFYIDNLRAASGKKPGPGQAVLLDNNIVFRSHNQDILFPDGRHRLSFSRFLINLKNKLVTFDSCTIAAEKKDSSRSSFNVFFDKLLLTNIDFDTLYKSEVIKADSVYCVNPTFNLTVEVAKKKDGSKPPPKLENIIKQLTGDILLGFVVVSHADFNIKTIKNTVPSSFTFSNNNFEMQGLSIDQDEAKPIQVKSFAMAIRNYENFIKDSSYSIKFDSILFNNDHLTLSNFLFNNLNNGKVLNTFRIPQFNLYGFSWDDLVFDRKLSAEQAILFNPYIHYTARGNQTTRSGNQNIFQSLGAVNEFIDLQEMDIENGKIDLKLKNNLQVQLDHASFSIKSQSLLASKKLAGIKNALTRLQFEKGLIHTGNLDIEMHNTLYYGQSGKFGAGQVQIHNKEKNMDVTLKEVQVEKIQVDEVSRNIYAEGVRWQKGDVQINEGGFKKGTGESTIKLKNVQGVNTVIRGLYGSKQISTKLNRIAFNDLEKLPDNKLNIDGLAINGEQLKVKDTNLDLSIAEYEMTDHKSSSFRQVLYQSKNGRSAAVISIPSGTVTPHIQSLINGEIILDAVNLVRPEINLQLFSKQESPEKKDPGFPGIAISELKLSQPKIFFSQSTENGNLSLDWQGERNDSSLLLANDLRSGSGNMSLSNLRFFLTHFVVTHPKGKMFSSGDGKISAHLKNIRFTQKGEPEPEWEAHISSFDARDFRLDNLGKSKGNFKMNRGSLNNLNISSSSITGFQKLAATNAAFQIKLFTGSYADSLTNFNWTNAGFNRADNTFSLDSFSYNPSQKIDAFLSKKLFQADYITFKSGAIRVGPVDLDQYIRDHKLQIGTIVLNDFLFTDFKDKKLPFQPGIIKPLPVNLLKNIPQQFSIDTLLLNNAQVDYTETGEKTKLPGTITVNRMAVRLISVKNYNLTSTDSLHIQANGYLMDKAWIRLGVKESYTDTSGGFRMTLYMKPVDLTIFNAALLPLTSVQLVSGLLDTLSMRAIGREYLSLGEMKMYYHNLKVRFLKDGDGMKKTFRNRLITFFANSFVLKNKNTSRTGRVFFIRDRERSAINYLIKIASSGIASSVGISSNRKMLRTYKRELKEQNLPPVDFK